MGVTEEGSRQTVQNDQSKFKKLKAQQGIAHRTERDKFQDPLKSPLKWKCYS